MTCIVYQLLLYENKHYLLTYLLKVIKQVLENQRFKGHFYLIHVHVHVNL